MGTSRIDTITFDLWNTLISHDELYDESIRRARTEGIMYALKEKGIIVGMYDLERAHELSGQKLQERWSGDMDVDVEGQLEIFLRCLNVDPSPDNMTAIESPYTDAVLKVNPYLVDGALEAVRDMKERGYRIALISNTGRTPGKAMRKVMKNFGLLDLFEVTVFSNEVGYQKPHKKIFETTLDMIGSAPSRAVHIGDHSVLDVLGARRMGMRSVRVMKHAKKDDGHHEPDIYIDDITGLPEAITKLEK